MSNSDKILKLIKSGIIVSPITREPFKQSGDNSFDDSSGITWFLKDGVFAKTLENHSTDDLDRIKSFFKKYPKLYKLLILIFSPVSPDPKFTNAIDEKIDSLDDSGVSLNLGSGSSKIHTEILNVDISNFKNVDIVADISKLPLIDESADCIVNNAVLEHVTNPEDCVREFARVLKKDGVAFIFVPFMQGFHASPHDYWRWTESGCKELFAKYFDNIVIAPSGGPTSGFLWVLQEWLALVCSIFTPKLHPYFYILSMLVLFPIKFLDFLLIKHPFAKNISSGFTIVARKSK